MSKKITYIIPLHKKDERVFRAIKSVPEGAKIFVSGPTDVIAWLESEAPNHEGNYMMVDGGDLTPTGSYPELVNYGIDRVLDCSEEDKPDYINILEFDDTVIENANNIINEYATDWEDVDILAPLACVVIETNEDKPTLIGISNEAAMAPQVAEEYGYFDFNMMLRTNFIFVNGCYIKPSVFEEFGKFKKNFELFYDYEWALRMVYNGVTIRSIPKATHFHAMTNDGAFETQKAIPEKTKDNWLGAARREYFFEDDRVIKFD